MNTRAGRSVRRIAAAVFPALLFALAAAGAADEPEKRPPRKEQKKPDQEQHRTAPQRQAAPDATERPQQRHTPPAATERTAPQRAPEAEHRRRPEQQPASRPAHPDQPAPQTRRPAPSQAAPVRTSPPPRNPAIGSRPPEARVVNRTSTGQRTVVVQRPDQTVIVSRAPNRGYVQRPVVVANTTYVHRTYVQNNVVVTRVYRPVVHRGVTFAVYTPVRYYPRPFYSWTCSPWRTPVRYNWGWYGDPWYGYYRGYFTPYPVYSSPTLWLTDYLIATTLQAAYMDREAQRRAAAANVYGGAPVPLSPEVKQAISAEVQYQIQYERGQAGAQDAMASAGGLPAGLADNRRHLFVVDRGLDVPNMSMGGQTCPLSEGDVLEMNGAAPGDADAAGVTVASSKPGSCARGSRVSVYLADLSEMQNHLRETVDQGMEELRAKQGQGGLPALPADAAPAPMAASFAAQLPPPDPNAAAELRQQYEEPAAQEVPAAAQPALSNAPGAAPSGVVSVYGGPIPAAAAPTVSAGQTIEQVTALLGQPKSIADLGSKKVYVFQDLKVTFIDGLVADVQ